MRRGERGKDCQEERRTGFKSEQDIIESPI